MISWMGLLGILGFVILLTYLRLVLAGTGDAQYRRVSAVYGPLSAVLVSVYFIIDPLLLGTSRFASGSMKQTVQVGDHVLLDKLTPHFRPPRRGEIVVFSAPLPIEEGDTVNLVKRVVGVEGDTVEVKPASMTILGQAYRQDEHDQMPLHLFLRQALHLGSASLKIVDGGVAVNGKAKLDSRAIASALGTDPKTLRMMPGKVLVNGTESFESCEAEDPDDGMPAHRIRPGCVFLMGDNRNQSWDSRGWEEISSAKVSGIVRARLWPPSAMGVIR